MSKLSNVDYAARCWKAWLDSPDDGPEEERAWRAWQAAALHLSRVERKAARDAGNSL